MLVVQGQTRIVIEEEGMKLLQVLAVLLKFGLRYHFYTVYFKIIAVIMPTQSSNTVGSLKARSRILGFYTQKLTINLINYIKLII